MKAKQHYDTLLGGIYSWMSGGFIQKMNEQKQFFAQNDIRPISTKIALDLGAGHGLQSVALAELQFIVTAVDFSKQLLGELLKNKGNLNINAVEDDILRYLRRFTDQAELIVCMGDTLTHFENIAQVEELLHEVSLHLECNGKLVLSFRDLTFELKGQQRFIAVRSDATKILTCFLEYYPDRVMVHDILQERDEGKWIQKVSCYPKLRLNEQMILELFKKHGIDLAKSEVINGMIYMIGRRSA